MARLGAHGVTSREPIAPTDAPAARRLGSSRWRDPRLAVGIVLVAASVVVGARVVAAADDTVEVWSLRQDVSAGSALTADDVTVSRLHFADAADAGRYFDGDESLPADLVADHDLVAGELLARSALVEPESKAVSELPLPVTNGRYPADLATGDRVDVWVTPEDAADDRRGAEQVLDSVAVLDLDQASTSVGGGDSAVVLVALEPNDAAALDALLTAAATGSVSLVRVGE
jgi:Flp pilus assembly protein CpaB